MRCEVCSALLSIEDEVQLVDREVGKLGGVAHLACHEAVLEARHED